MICTKLTREILHREFAYQMHQKFDETLSAMINNSDFEIVEAYPANLLVKYKGYTCNKLFRLEDLNTSLERFRILYIDEIVAYFLNLLGSNKRKIRASVSMYVYCPCCGAVLYRDHEQNILRCEMSYCTNFKVRFKAPQIELERAEEEKIDG